MAAHLREASRFTATFAGLVDAVEGARRVLLALCLRAVSAVAHTGTTGGTPRALRVRTAVRRGLVAVNALCEALCGGRVPLAHGPSHAVPLVVGHGALTAALVPHDVPLAARIVVAPAFLHVSARALHDAPKRRRIGAQRRRVARCRLRC